MSPLPQSLGIVSLSQMVSNKLVRTLVPVLKSAFNISAWMESTPGAFPPFIALMAFLTSASVGGLVSMLRSSVTGGGQRVHLVEGGSGLHRNIQPIYQLVHVQL